MKHLKQLVEYITGMDTRIGYPNEHLAGDSDEEVASPLYATAVGLLMNSLEANKKNQVVDQEEMHEEEVLVGQEHDMGAKTNVASHTERKSIFDKWSEKLKDFLDNAE